MNKIFLPFLALVAMTNAKPQITVLNFDGDSKITKDQISAISDRVQAELFKTDSFTVLDRGNIDKILQEQNFQESGACNESSCQVKIGQLLGVEKLVTGKVVNFGPTWSLSAQLLDVTSGAVIRSESIDQSGELNDALRFGCPRLAHRLVGLPDEGDKVESKNSKLKMGLKWGGLGLAVLGGTMAYLADKDVSDNNSKAKSLANLADFDVYSSKAKSAESSRSLYSVLAGAGLLSFGLSFTF